MTSRPVRVFIVDDHQLFRSGVRRELEDAVEIIGEASEVEPAIDMIKERLPDVVLLDVHMPGGGGRAVIEAVHKTHPDIRFLALSVSDNPEDVVEVVQAGARGYVTKSILTDELRDAISRVSDGDAVFSPRLAGFVLDAFSSVKAADVDADLDRLSQREREVLRLIALGYTYKETANSLHIAPKTVESHVSSVLRKLHLSNRHQLTRWAEQRRLV
ncbi:MAG: response regulator transcription factor [Actinomycetota bacterium]